MDQDQGLGLGRVQMNVQDPRAGVQDPRAFIRDPRAAIQDLLIPVQDLRRSRGVQGRRPAGAPPPRERKCGDGAAACMRVPIADRRLSPIRVY